MDLRRLLHPLPVVLIILFVAVAVADLVQTLTEEPPPPPELVGSASPRFEALEPVIDFRSHDGDPKLEFLPIPELAQGQWSSTRSSGVWARGPVAGLELDLATGGHRVLVLEGMPTSGKRPAHAVRLDMNGVECGEVALESGWRVYKFDLPEGVARPGTNHFSFSFPDSAGVKKKPRELLVRRLALLFAGEIDDGILDATRPLSFDFDSDRVTIRRSGILEMPLALEDRTDALQMRFRFSADAGRAEIEVVQAQPGEAGSDDAVRSSMNAGEKASGRIRLPLHGRRGAYVLRIRVDLTEPGSRLLLSSVKLVEEGDPTRHPRAAGPSPN